MSTKEQLSESTCLILFQCVHDVIKSERLIKINRFDYQIIPVPSDINSECGMGIEISLANSNDICSLLDQNHINHNLYLK